MSIIKRAALVILILFTIAHRNAECSPFIAGYISYIYSNEDTAAKSNHSIGYEAFFSGFDVGSSFHFCQKAGFFIRGANNQSSLELKYSLNLTSLFFEFIMLGPGININTSNKGFFSPQFNITLFWILITLDFAYRYNIYYNQTNSHEFCFTVGLIDLFSFINLLRW